MARVSADLLMLLSEVAAAGSINRASAKMGLPKSTISRRLKQLEHDVGTILVKRGTRQISLTDIGMVLLERSQRIAAEVEFAHVQAIELQTMLRGELRVSLPIDFGVNWIGHVLGNFATAYPEIDLRIHVNAHAVDISQENYDVAIHLGPFAGAQDLPTRILSKLSRGLYASPDYIARRGLPECEADLRFHDCVIHEQQAKEGIWPLPEVPAVGEKPVRRIQSNNISLVRDMVVRGAGIGVLTDAMCQGEVRAGRLVPVALDMALPSFVASATFLHSRQIPRKTRVFIDYLVQSLQGSQNSRASMPPVPNMA